MIDYLYIQPVT